jgi:hypothetical protein
MATILKPNEVPIAYSMIAAAKRVRPRRDGQHPYQEYFYLWTAFNNIYSTLASREGLRTQLKLNADGSVATYANGNVKIPEVVEVDERDQVQAAVRACDDELKHTLVLHESTQYFVTRVPYWQGQKIECDALGQRVNGVINVNSTTDIQYPVWSPVDVQYYEEYLDHPTNDTSRNFLAQQSVELLHTVRKNLMRSSNKFDDSNDIAVIKNALPLLKLIVSSFTR